MKKLVSILLATLLVLSIAGAAMAEGLVVANLPKSVGGALPGDDFYYEG